MTNTLENTPPSTFDRDSFAETLLIIISKPKIFTQESILTAAEAAGGDKLRNAMDEDAPPPCSPGIHCLKCWVAQYCVHKYAILEEQKHDNIEDTTRNR